MFQHIHMDATISGEVPELAHSIEKVDLSYTSCTSLVIFCLIDEDVFPNLVSIGLEAIKMSKKDVTEIPLRRPTVMELPSPCPFLYGMPDMSEDDFSDVADFGPDLTDHMVMVSLIGVDQSLCFGMADKTAFLKATKCQMAQPYNLHCTAG